MEKPPKYIVYTLIKDFEVSLEKQQQQQTTISTKPQQTPLLRKLGRMHLGKTEKKEFSKWMQGRNIFYLSKIFLHLGELIKQESVHKISH